MTTTFDGISWTVEQKESMVQFNLFANGEKLVEALNIPPDDAEKFADALIIAVAQARRWERINEDNRNPNQDVP